MSAGLLIASLLLAAICVVALQRGSRLWVVAMTGGEAAGWFLGVALLGAWFSRGDAAATIARLLFVAAGLGFSGLLVLGWRDARQVVRLARAAGAGPVIWSPLASVISPVLRRPRGASRGRGIAYGPHPRHVLDRAGPDPAQGPRPALIHLHGGGWWRGRRHTQARPLLTRLVAAGWHVFTPSYRLSPEATVPDHLVDVKRAIAWIRGHAGELGVDPAFIAVAGGSAGGNLAALAALSAGDEALQPGFESADTSVQACVPCYGVHDLLDDDGAPRWPYLEAAVVKASPRDAPERWREASPVHRATARRPPFVVVHGAADTLVPAAVSTRLVGALRSDGGPAAVHLEVPGANHGFDFFAGPRGRATAGAVVALLDGIRRDAAR